MTYPFPATAAAPRGVSLAEVLEAYRAQLPLDVALGVTREVALLLERAHRAGHVHGALSPHAVWLAENADLFLDWHPARGPAHRGVAPEVRVGAHPGVDSDVYALGAVLYELVTGLGLSRGWAKGPLVLETEAPAPRAVAPSVPEALDEVITRCLLRDRGARPGGVRPVIEALEASLEGAKWEWSLKAIAAEPFFAPWRCPVPLTCERAGAAALKLDPSLAATQRPPALQPVTPLETTAVVGARARPTSLARVAVATGLAAAASFAVCLGVVQVALRGQAGVAARAGRALAGAPPRVTLAQAPPVEVEPAEPVISPRAQAKVKAERPHASKRGAVTHRKRRAR